MKKFSYQATDVNGKTVRGQEMAEDYQDLQQKLKEKNLYVTIYRDLGANDAVDVKYRFKTKEVSFISRQLASMTSAGLSLVRALYILQEQQEKPKAKRVLLDIYEEVQKGKSFSEVLESKPGVFPDLFVSMVAAGEASGTLDQILIRVSDHFANANKTNNKVKGALVYPVILLILALAVIILMFTAILPTFANMMSPDDMTPLSRAMLSFSDSLINHWYIYLIVIGVIILLFWVGRKTPSVKLKMDELILRMPKVGKLISTIYTGRFARNMSNLYAAGLQMVDCIEKSVSVLGNSYVNKRFEEVVDNIKLGESMSKAVEKTGIFEGMFTSIIFVGEESGTLDTILSKAADYYEEEGDTAITKLVGMLEPVMIIIMGVAIGLVLAAIFPMLYGGMTNVS
ncbi:MAG TPA: type II secretion system F family protein [Ruminococcaceae bacterium]|nr:type II secretion system F family protein [Oscillospiraceae bacterium]HBJ25635.1 type II secretion system F family protein [Oscillospiraceae bacterium]